ncbi:MAG: chemotaxis protein CheW [Azovibrio restrictus]|nr:chemotaxis protein CheW [Azovibrio restrictus]
MSQFYQVFFEESAEHLAEMESLLLGLDVAAPESEDLNAIFRAAHSIKGSSGTFGFTDLAELTHVLENLLDKIRKNEIPLRAEMVDAFLETGDLLKTMLAAHQGGEAADPGTVAAVSQRLQQLTDGGEDSAGTPVTAAAGAGAPAAPAGEAVARSAGPGERGFCIEFVPTAASAGHGVEGFVAELSQHGRVQVLQQPPQDEPVGFWSLRLLAPVLPDSVREQLDFVAEKDAWRIEEDRSVGSDGAAAFGFFDDAPGLSDETRGYGFFDPLPDAGGESEAYGFFTPLPEPEAAASGVTPAADPDGAYGFFDPLPAEAAAPAADEGYGFFEPLPTPEPAAMSPSVEPLAQPQDAGDGSYGFFEPLPVPPLAAPAPLPPVQQLPEAKPEPTPPAPVPAAAPKPQKSGKAVVAAGGDSSIRVSVEKVDQLINLVGELVITQAMLLQTVAQMQEAAPERLVNGLTQLERNSRDLQEAVMSIRMLPISFVFSRFPRVVRDLSAKLGKQVELKTIGDTTELDKGLIERIADPLTHLIRNSLDHGIESPEKRAALGKNPCGTITLKASHQGGNVVIEVGDDGAGLNRDRILAKAREKGLQVSEQMTDQEVFALIFEAGFSTADQVTDVSGRGVGMDVVRRNIQELGGRIEIESMLGIGTRMTVRLPLTLAILDGMSVAVGDQTYILPLSYVMESLQPEPGDIKTLANQGRVIQVRGEYLPVVVLHEIFNIQKAVTHFNQGIMVVLDADGASAALFVDALVGQHQVVIKSLEANYRRVPGISGATIMGDGHVALILDVSAIVGMGKQQMQKAA